MISRTSSCCLTRSSALRASARVQGSRRSMSHVKWTALRATQSLPLHLQSSLKQHACWRRELRQGDSTIYRRLFSTGPAVTDIHMPALSPTMTHGTITNWVKKPGEKCSAGDVLCEIETDKATVAFEVQDDYVLAKIVEQAGAREVKVGELVALSVEDEAAYEAFVKLDKAGGVVAPAPKAPTSAPPAPEPPKAVPPVAHSTGPLSISPAARHWIQSKGISHVGIIGSGKAGMITKGDVLQALASGKVVAKPAEAAVRAPQPVPVAPPVSASASKAVEQLLGSGPSGPFEDVKNSNMRKIIARRLSESKAGVPHFYQSVECELDAALKLRSTLKKEYEVAFSVNDLIIRSAALALRDVPEANAFWDAKKSAASLNGSVDISVAVATPSGLITPIIPQVDKKGLVEITTKMKDLAGRAKANKLKPEEFQGGSFTISNLGMFGIDEFSAVINPPQACIMAVGRGAKKIRVAYPKDPSEKPKPRVATVLTATLSADRRVIDEAIAAQFLQAFRAYLSNPQLLVV